MLTRVTELFEDNLDKLSYSLGHQNVSVHVMISCIPSIVKVQIHYFSFSECVKLIYCRGKMSESVTTKGKSFCHMVIRERLLFPALLGAWVGLSL